MGNIKNYITNRTMNLYKQEVNYSDKAREFYADKFGNCIGFRIHRENGVILEYDAVEMFFLPKDESLLEKYKDVTLIDVAYTFDNFFKDNKIIERYTEIDMETCFIVKAPNERYFNYYSEDSLKHGYGSVGPFDSLPGAKEAMHKHRPTVKRLYTGSEWKSEQYTDRWGDNPYNRSRVEAGEFPESYIGRRTVMVGGTGGATLLTEGYHFFVDDEEGKDYMNPHKAQTIDKKIANAFKEIEKKTTYNKKEEKSIERN